MMRQALASTIPMMGMLTVAVSPIRVVRLVIAPSVGDTTWVLLSFQSAIALSALALSSAPWWALMLVCALAISTWEIVIAAVARRSSSFHLSSSERGAYCFAARSARRACSWTA